MTKIRSILAATDFSPIAEAVVRRALSLAEALGLPLCLLYAFDANTWRNRTGALHGDRPAGAQPPESRMRQRLANSAAALGEQTAVEISVHFGVGPTAEVIDTYVSANVDALVVVGSRAEPDLSGRGSTALQEVRAPACPILIVRVAEERPYAKVLSAVDLREGSMRAASLAVDLFPDAHHHLLCALDPATDSDAWDEDVEPEEARLQHELLHAQAEQELQQFAQRLSVGARYPLVAIVANDVPARAILVGADSLRADCVVVGHHGQGAATDSFLGSIAQHVIYAAMSDVLVVP